MTANIKHYIFRCDQCQHYKSAFYSKATLKPQKTSVSFWEHIGIDLITQLPRDTKSKMNSVAVYIDHYSDQCHLVPVDSTVTVESMARVHYIDIFCLHNFLKKIFSDCGPQFAVWYMSALYKCLSIKTRLITVYHSEGNNKVEHKNYKVEKFL